MGLTSLQVCMDSSDWLQGTMHEDESGMDSSSSPSAAAVVGDMDMLTCSRPSMIDRRLRPPHDQSLKCPRCDSTHTKFCYYNNYSLSQPRYFCKTCRRYWTKGGTLRNIPVGGGCRKNKKPSSSSKKCSSNENSPAVNNHNPADLHLSFPPAADVQFSHISNFLGTHHFNNNNNSFMDSKLEAIVGNSVRNYDFMGNFNNGGEHIMDHHHHNMGVTANALAPSFHGLCSPFGMGLEHGSNNIINNNIMLPYEVAHHQDHQNMGMDVKPKLLSLEWQDQQACSDSGKDSFGYVNAMGSWSGMMNSYGSSAANPLI